MIVTPVCCKYSKETRDEVLITNNNFSGTCSGKGDCSQGICGYLTRLNCQFTTKEIVRVCSIKEQLIFFKNSSKISSKNGMDLISVL